MRSLRNHWRAVLVCVLLVGLTAWIATSEASHRDDTPAPLIAPQIGSGAACLNRLQAQFSYDSSSSFGRTLNTKIIAKCQQGPSTQSVEDAASEVAGG